MPILNWSLVSPFGIQPAGTQGDVWHAGHVTDVLLLDDQNILVAAETGGVWRLSSNGDATPLSHSWDNPDVRCLAFGPDYRNQVFAGCKSSSGIGALWVTDHTAQGDPLLAWNRVALPGVTGSIFCVLVLLDSGRIVIGTQRGIWWAHLQNDPTAYPWVRPQWAGAPGNPANGQCFGLAEGPNGSVVASIVGVGLFYGEWTPAGDLRMQASAPVTGLNMAAMQETSVASSRGDRSVLYAAANSGAAGTLYALLSSADGGHSWTQLNFPAGDAQVINNTGARGPQRFGLGMTGWYTNTIAVSPVNPSIVALGWTSGPFLSSDGGHKWRQYNNPPATNVLPNPGPGVDRPAVHPALHADLHVVKFNDNGDRLFIGSDGGIVAAEIDAGAAEAPELFNFESTYNVRLANLQFEGIPGRLRQLYGTCSVNEGTAAGGVQDNGSIYCEWTRSSPWRQVGDSDGELTLVLPNGDLLFDNSSDMTVPASAARDGNGMGTPAKVHRWWREDQRFDDTGLILLDPNGHAYTVVGDTVSMPALPSCYDMRFAIRAVAAGDNLIFGLFEDNRLEPFEHWEPLASVRFGPSLPGESNPYITAVASYDGLTILAGANTGRIFRISMQASDPCAPAVQTEVSPANRANAGPISRLLVDTSGSPVMRAFALGGSRTILQLDNGSVIGHNPGSWRALSSPGQPAELIFDIAVDWNATPPRLFAATDTKVFRTVDRTTWVDISQGLPAAPHCAGLVLAANRLFLGTFGRSMWVGTHPCQTLMDAVSQQQEQVDTMRDDIASGEYPPPPRTPDRIAAARAELRRLEGVLRQKARQLALCQSANPHS